MQADPAQTPPAAARRQSEALAGFEPRSPAGEFAAVRRLWARVMDGMWTRAARLGALAGVIGCLAGAGAEAASAHAWWRHSEELFTPRLHYIRWLRTETNETLRARCRPVYRIAYRPAGLMPVGLREFAWREWRARLREARRSSNDCLSVWVRRQIWAAGIIARESAGDPWPHCPDPYDGSGASWWDTVACENGGSWMDSPGFYRCGLQFDPMWERRFGRLCP